MLNRKLLLLIVCTFNAININAQIASVFEGFKFGDSLSTVQKELVKISDSISVVKVPEPNFPLSKNTETHLLAYKIRLKTGTLEKAVFTFSDNHLTYIEAKGNCTQVFTANREDTAVNFMEYLVFTKDLLFILKKEDAAWLLTPESVHPNLFAWNNPLLISPTKLTRYNLSARIPDFITMGSSLKKQLQKLKKVSKIIEVVDLDDSDPNAQTQINAYGIEYAGFPRKFEARFKDGKLTMVWILTAKGEEKRIRAALTKEYGKAVFVNDKWEFFNNWTVGLRKDKPEVLFLNKELALQYKKSLSK